MIVHEHVLNEILAAAYRRLRIRRMPYRERKKVRREALHRNRGPVVLVRRLETRYIERG